MSTKQIYPIHGAFVSPSGKKLRVVILDCPYDTMDHPLVQDLFPKVLALKIQGYRSEHPYGVMPVDSGDFVGCHVLLCEESDAGLNPIMGFKSITEDRCRTFQLEFPAYHLLDHTRLFQHRKAITECLENAKKEKARVGYNGSWTMSPDARAHRDFARIVKDMSISFLALYYQTYHIKYVVAAAVVRFKVDHLKRFIGFKQIELRGKALKNFDSPAFFGEELALMFLNEFSVKINQLAENFKDLWANRLVISKETLYPEKEIKAA